MNHRAPQTLSGYRKRGGDWKIDIQFSK